MMIFHSEKIQGRAKNAVLEHGAYLRTDNSPCNKKCTERAPGCRSWCKKGQAWEKNHRLALEELNRLKENTDISHLKTKSKKEWDRYRIKEVPRMRRGEA